MLLCECHMEFNFSDIIMLEYFKCWNSNNLLLKIICYRKLLCLKKTFRDDVDVITEDSCEEFEKIMTHEMKVGKEVFLNQTT